MRVVVALEWACVLCGRHIQNDWVSRATKCVKLCVKLEHCSAETIQMIQKAMASSRQHTHSCVMSLAEFIGESSNHPGDSAPLQPRFGALQLLDFLKTKIAYEREEISDCQWDSGKYNVTAYGDCENYVRSQGTTFEGEWGITVLCTVFLVSCLFFNKCLYFWPWLMAQWIKCKPVNQRVSGSIPSQRTCLGYGPGPRQRACERQPHTDVSLPLFLLYFPLSKNKFFKKVFFIAHGWILSGQTSYNT